MTDGLEVGRFALRTFKIHNGHLTSVVARNSGRHWGGGVCKAQCVLFEDSAFFLESMQRLDNIAPLTLLAPDYLYHNAPYASCRCGIYGSLNLQNLRRQYAESLFLVTVIAAEGQTIIGTRGLRTEFARIVAFWTPWFKWGTRRTCRRECPGATEYRNLDKMLADYGIPQTGSALAPTHSNNLSWWTE